MIASEVPMHSCMRTASGTSSKRKTSNNTGTMMAPPPMPNSPARMPVRTPASMTLAANQTNSPAIPGILYGCLSTLFASQAYGYPPHTSAATASAIARTSPLRACVWQHIFRRRYRCRFVDKRRTAVTQDDTAIHDDRSNPATALAEHELLRWIVQWHPHRIVEIIQHQIGLRADSNRPKVRLQHCCGTTRRRHRQHILHAHP